MTHAILWLALAGCGDKEPTKTAAAAEAKPKPVSHVPDDANSKAFAEAQAMDIRIQAALELVGGRGNPVHATAPR
jgi:hypothetical protein